MYFTKHIITFIKNNLIQLQRKWLSLSLLLVFPLIIVLLIAMIVIPFFNRLEQEPIQIGIVDLDDTKETKLIIGLLRNSPEFKEMIQIEELTETEAIRSIENSEISAYMMLPESFTKHLYNGHSVNLEVVGNEQKQIDSYLIKLLVDSIATHINGAQANILTIHTYAEKLNLSKKAKQKLMKDQFKSFLLYTAGKDKIITEDTLLDDASMSPINYYSLSSLFIIITIWLLFIYNFFEKIHNEKIKQRMHLYGVTERQQICAKIVTTLLVTSLFTLGIYFAFIHILAIHLEPIDHIRILFLMLLYSISYLLFIAIIDIWMISKKLQLLMQAILTCILLLTSGAIIPTIYFPLYLQTYIPYSFTYTSFYWIKEIILNERVYFEYSGLLGTALTLCIVGIFISLWKEVKQ